MSHARILESSTLYDPPRLTGRKGYQMIRSFKVENFRPFKRLELDGMPAVNIVVGKSASGKTALLEALRLALGATPNVAWVLNSTRGIATPMNQNPTKEQFESAWKPYFYDFNIEAKISFELVDSEGRNASLKVYFDPARPVTPVPTNSGQHPNMPLFTNTIIPLAFERRNFVGDENTIDATVSAQHFGHLHLQQGAELGLVSEFFPSTWQANAQQVAAWFSQLRIRNQSEDIVEIVSEQFPDITALSTETPFGMPSVYATLKHHSEMMPIGMVSSGINKFICLLIAIRTYKGGVVLIDEIENGIYYQMFPALWKSLHKFAIDNDTQLFLTSHSWECLKGASMVMASNADDFSLIQVSHEEGMSSAHVATGKNAAAAIELGVEVRK